MPGVSTSSRRSSGCDGFASSSSWNTVRIPNTLPRTAKRADRRDGRARRRRPTEAPSSCEHARVEVARRRGARTSITTRTFTTATASPAWTKTWSRSPRRTATMPAIPPRKHVGRELERGPVDGPGEHRDQRGHQTVAAPASSRTVRSIPTAAVRQEDTAGRRPAVSFSANVGEQRASSPSSSRTLLRCQSSRPEAPDPGRAGARRRGPRAGDSRTSRATSRSRSLRPNCVDRLEIAARDPVALVGRWSRPARTI